MGCSVPTYDCPFATAGQHGTNRYGMKLSMMVTVDHTGATKILAASLLACEDEQSFRWVAECFEDAFCALPKVVFTDSDPAMDAAFAAVWGTVLHYLCIWHLAKNMKTNLNPACVGVSDLAARLASKWWRICKLTDKQSIATFDAEWKELVHTLETEAKVSHDSPAYKKALNWLEKAGPASLVVLHSAPPLYI